MPVTLLNDEVQCSVTWLVPTPSVIAGLFLTEGESESSFSQGGRSMLTDWELSKSSFPSLPFRLSQRQSNSITKPAAPRSFDDLQPWPRFLEDAEACASQLDNVIKRNYNPMEVINPLDEAADEIGVRVPLEAHILPRVNQLATRLGLAFCYKQGGSGRSFSYTDLIILDSSQPQPTGPRKDLSSRVFGIGEAKGNWQCTLAGFASLDAALADARKGDRIKQVIQQVFGDMVLDETKYGFITEYNYTVFFRRVVGTKSLEYSPIVEVGDAPLEKFLFVLQLAETDKHLKSQFSRLAVKETIQLLQQTTVTRSGRASKRQCQFMQVSSEPKKRRPEQETTSSAQPYDEQDLDKIPTYEMGDLGITGTVIGMGKYGNVVEGKAADGTKLALKLFDLRFPQASSSLLREQVTYDALQSLQGVQVPQLLAVGRLPHTSVVFLALTNEAGSDVVKLLQGTRSKDVQGKIMDSLLAIHQLGVRHNDMKISHILWNRGAPKFIDFDASIVRATRDELLEEMALLEEELDEVTNGL